MADTPRDDPGDYSDRLVDAISKACEAFMQKYGISGYSLFQLVGEHVKVKPDDVRHIIFVEGSDSWDEAAGGVAMYILYTDMFRET